MGWGEIAHELGLHPGVLGQGHAKKSKFKNSWGTDSGSDDEIFDEDIEAATARDFKEGKAKGHSEFKNKSEKENNSKSVENKERNSFQEKNGKSVEKKERESTRGNSDKSADKRDKKPTKEKTNKGKKK